MTDHVIDVLPICHHIVTIIREVIAKSEFVEGIPQMASLQTILEKARHTL